jgi:hypothetical protein
VAGVVLLVVDPPVDGGALWSPGVGVLPLSSWRFFGAAGVDFLELDFVAARRRIWRLLKISWMKLVWFGSTTTAPSGVGLVGPAFGHFPCVRGLHSIQGDEESRSGGVPPAAPWATMSLTYRKGKACAVFSSFCVDLSVIVLN